MLVSSFLLLFPQGFRNTFFFVRGVTEKLTLCGKNWKVMSSESVLVNNFPFYCYVLPPFFTIYPYLKFEYKQFFYLAWWILWLLRINCYTRYWFITILKKKKKISMENILGKWQFTACHFSHFSSRRLTNHCSFCEFLYHVSTSSWPNHEKQLVR